MFVEPYTFAHVYAFCICASDDEYSVCIRVTGILTLCFDLLKIHAPAAPGSAQIPV